MLFFFAFADLKNVRVFLCSTPYRKKSARALRLEKIRMGCKQVAPDKSHSFGITPVVHLALKMFNSTAIYALFNSFSSSISISSRPHALPFFILFNACSISSFWYDRPFFCIYVYTITYVLVLKY